MDDAFVGYSNILQKEPLITAWQSYTPTFTGFGTPSSVQFQWRQLGENIEIRGKFTIGTSTATEARVTLPGSYTSAGADKIPSLQVVGKGNITSPATTNFGGVPVLIEPSLGYVVFGAENSSANWTTKRNGNALGGSGDIFSFFASVPIAGLQGSTSTYSSSCGAGCVDTFSAKVSAAGAVTDENVDWINGNCSRSGVSDSDFSCPLRSGVFTVAPNCSLTPLSNLSTINLVNTTTSAVTGNTSIGGSYANAGFHIECKKTGADFVATRTITGSFKEVVTTPGTNAPVLCSAKISATGVISDQRGGCFASCTNATTPVCTFTSNYWVSGSVPNCWAQNISAAGGYQGRANTLSTTQFSGVNLDNANNAVAGDRMYFCHGERQ